MVWDYTVEDNPSDSELTLKNTSIILGPIETTIVSRLTYEKKSIVTANDLDLFV